MTDATAITQLTILLTKLGFSSGELQQHKNLLFALQDSLRQDGVDNPTEVIRDLTSTMSAMREKAIDHVDALDWILTFSPRLTCKPIDWLIRCGYEGGIDEVVESAAIYFSTPTTSNVTSLHRPTG
jgi:hypothetical protein